MRSMVSLGGFSSGIRISGILHFRVRGLGYRRLGIRWLGLWAFGGCGLSGAGGTFWRQNKRLSACSSAVASFGLEPRSALGM